MKPTIRRFEVKRIYIAAGIVAAIAMLSAQASSIDLYTTISGPTVDGVSAASEYNASEVSIAGAQLWYHLSPEGALTVAVKAPTAGWVGIGFGTQKMDGASIVIGFVKDGKAEYKSVTGRGRTLVDGGSLKPAAIAFGEASGFTTLEMRFDAMPYVKSGKLDFIVAYGPADSFAPKHVKRGSGSFTLR